MEPLALLNTTSAESLGWFASPFFDDHQTHAVAIGSD